MNKIKLLIQTLRMYKKLRRSSETLGMFTKEICFKLLKTAKMNRLSGRRMLLLSSQISTRKLINKVKV